MKSRNGPFQLQSSAEIGHDGHAAQKISDERLQFCRRIHLVNRPRDGANRQFGRLGFGPRSRKLGDSQRCLSELLRGELLENFSGAIGIAQNNGVQVSAERGFQGGNEFRFDIQARHERARDRGPEAFRIVESFQNGLRSFFQSVPFLGHLAEDFEPCLLLRDRSLEPCDFFFGVRDARLVLVQPLFCRAQILFSLLGGLPLGFHRGPSSGEIRARTLQRGVSFADRLRQLRDSR